MVVQEASREVRGTKSAGPGHSGASAVEFALVLPVLLLVLMFAITGSVAYNGKVALTHAARESARWAATLPTTNTALDPVPTAWFLDVIDRAEATAAGQVDAGAGGRYVCVAYVEDGDFDDDGDGTPDTARTLRYEQTPTGTSTTPGVGCFDDGITTAEPRIQVRLGRDARLDAIFLRRDLELRSQAVARFEHTSPYAGP